MTNGELKIKSGHLKNLLTNKQKQTFKAANELSPSPDEVAKLADEIHEAITKLVDAFDEIKSMVSGLKWYEAWKFWPIIKKILDIIKNWDAKD